MSGVGSAELTLRVEALERENRELKRSVFELSSRLGQLHVILSQARVRSLDADAGEVAEGTQLSPHIVGPALASGWEPILGVPSVGALEGDGELRRMVHPSEPDVPRSFRCVLELSGHSGAVYCAKWAPEAELVASGSFDKTVLVHRAPLETAGAEPPAPVLRLEGHEQLVADLQWSTDGARVLSGSFDHTVKLWAADLPGVTATAKQSEIAPTTATPVASFAAEGLVHCVEFSGEDPAVFWCGTSAGAALRFDSRTPRAVGAAAGGGPPGGHGDGSHGTPVVVHALHVASWEPNQLLVGDARGVVRVVDVRMNAAIPELTWTNEAAGRPITCITSTYGRNHRHLLGVNSYDNVLRVYEDGLRARSPASVAASVPGAEAGEEEGAAQRIAEVRDSLFTLTGHRNKNWPIRSSFFSPARANPGLFGTPLGPPRVLSPASATGPSSANGTSNGSAGAADVLLATGSASTSAYVFRLAGKSSLAQKLTGHSGRVYACDFRRAGEEPVLATCSADATVRVWALANDV